MKEIMTVVYQANDGKTFSNKEECIKYETATLSLRNALEKIEFSKINNMAISFSIEEMIEFYLTDGETGFPLDFNNVDIVKISSAVSEEEIKILNEFFNLLNEYISIQVPPVYAGMVFYWDDRIDEWRDVHEALEELDKKRAEIENMLKF